MLSTALLLSAAGLLSGLPGVTEAKECDKPCMNGQCNAATGNCVCFPGWVGDQCQHCGGRFRYGEHKAAFITEAGRLNLRVGNTCWCAPEIGQTALLRWAEILRVLRASRDAS